MIILGVDPGSRKAGYGVIELDQRKIKLIASGTMRYDSTKEFIPRLGIIYESCKSLIRKYSPNEIAFESLIHVKNINSLSKLAQARGAMISGCLSSGELPISEYAPNKIKSSVVGFGHADKLNIKKTISILCGITEFKTDDESDAIAIAICHSLNRNNLKKRIYNYRPGR